MIKPADNIVIIDGKQFRETVHRRNGFTIVNKYPILTKEENEKRKEDILTKLYYYFTNKNT